MQLTLLIPHLLWPEPEDAVALHGLTPHGLNRLLARGTPHHHTACSFEVVLAELFGLDASAPFGALRLAGERLQPAQPEAFWLCADPVHLRFHQQRVVLADASAFALEMAEAQSIVNDLNRHFHDLGQFHVAHPQRWYLRVKDDVAAEFAADHAAAIPPLSAMAGRRMDGALPASPLAARLQRWQNEIQMFLHDHPVNVERSGEGHPAINGLWFWGPGQAPRIAPPAFATVWTSSPLAAGIARLAGIKVAPVAPGLTAVLNHAAKRAHELVVIDTLATHTNHDDGHHWRQTLEQLDAEWFGPLLSAHRVHQLELIAPTAFATLRWTLKGSDRWKLWRRPTTLATRIRQLAQETHP